MLNNFDIKIIYKPKFKIRDYLSQFGSRYKYKYLYVWVYPQYDNQENCLQCVF